MMPSPLLEARHLSVEFGSGSNLPFVAERRLRALDDINFRLSSGDILGVVGESGSGKSTLARALLRLVTAQSGTVHWMGEDISRAKGNELKNLRRSAQIVFQDPSASLNPRMTLGQVIAEPLRNFEQSLPRSIVSKRVSEVMGRVGLSPQLVNRYPHEVSGGQCQRVGIARAMILKPRLLICDEPVSALDVSVQAQIIALLRHLQHEDGMALIFVSHDLAIVRHLCHRVLVVYMGRIVESAPCASLFAAPRHPYTQTLLRSVPIPDPRIARSRSRIVVQGEPPSPFDPPSGCHFRTRCPYASVLCSERAPSPEEHSQDHFIACHHPQEFER